MLRKISSWFKSLFDKKVEIVGLHQMQPVFFVAIGTGAKRGTFWFRLTGHFLEKLSEETIADGVEQRVWIPVEVLTETLPNFPPLQTCFIEDFRVLFGEPDQIKCLEEIKDRSLISPKERREQWHISELSEDYIEHIRNM